MFKKKLFPSVSVNNGHIRMVLGCIIFMVNADTAWANSKDFRGHVHPRKRYCLKFGVFIV